MRRYWEERSPPSMLSGSLMLRLIGGFGMLVIVSLLIVRMGEPRMWRWLAGDNGRPPEKQSAPPPPIPEAAGPTHEDPDQAETAREEFQAMTDGSLKLRREEMEPYYRLVFWVKNQPFGRLRRLARRDLLYTNFHDEPDKYRGQLATMDLDVRRVLEAGEGRDGEKLREIWGFTDESWGHPYVAIVVDCPKDMPVGPSVREKAAFAGYFLKLQGYLPAESKPGDPIEKAPLLIGRIEWKPAVAPHADRSLEWIWGLALLVLVGLVLAARFLYFRLKPRRRASLPSVATSPSGEVISIDSWLEQTNLNADEDESNVENDDLFQGRKDLDGQ
ncbi:MAG: hypothetical protein KKE86_10120 [Planctomycetes bacterium]|nr:hypothetical protein [Planctomycetota bacterium]MCG2685029.1 hypothetical protein [Planctomycetales bacterium]